MPRKSSPSRRTSQCAWGCDYAPQKACSQKINPGLTAQNGGAKGFPLPLLWIGSGRSCFERVSWLGTTDLLRFPERGLLIQESKERFRKSMSVSSRRFFSCQSCGHKVRFGRNECGACYQPTPIINQSWFWLLILAAVLLLLVASSLAMS